MPCSSNLRAGPFCSRERPALLILTLTNGHLMVSHLARSDARTLAMLNTRHSRFINALALLQQGNLDYIAGRGVVALHRDWGEPWHEHQPRFYRNLSVAPDSPTKAAPPHTCFSSTPPPPTNGDEDFLAS